MTPSAPDLPNQEELFQKLAEGYDGAIRLYQATYEAMLLLSTDLARVTAPSGVRCLDYGTGTGAALPLLSAHFDEVVAIDPGEAMLDLARARAKVECAGPSAAQVSFIQGTITSPDAAALGDDSFDAIHCSLVLMFVKDDAEKIQVLQAFHRLLRPGGVLVLSELLVASDVDEEEARFALWRALMRHRGADDAFIAAAEGQVHRLMHRRSIEEIHALLSSAGFGRVQRPFQALHTAIFVATR
jgi:tRNA (cmo5U34)-methyltransferase